MKKLFFGLFFFKSILAIAQAPGSLDLSFGNGGKVVTSLTSGQDKSYGVAIQSDGKIVVGGFASSTTTGKDFACVRYNSNGSLDSTFGINGKVTIDIGFGTDDVAYSMALQPDLKILLAGYSDNGSNKNAAIIRLQNNGIIDSAFGINGKVLTDFDSLKQDEIKTIKVHALTGKIIVGGAAIKNTTISKPVVARYLSNGTIDSSFNFTGIKLLWITSLDYQYLYSVEDLVVVPNGKISAIGWRDFPNLSWDADYWACRINSDGTMDNTFSSDGVAVFNGSFNGNDKAYSTILTPSGDFIVAGSSYISTLYYDFNVFEISNTGSISGFGAASDFGDYDNIAYGLAEDINGNFVVGGSYGSSTVKTFGIVRFNLTDGLDTTFGVSGNVSTTFSGNSLNECFDIAIQPDNKIVAVGYTGNDFAISRYLGTGIAQLDSFYLITPSNNTTNQSYPNVNLSWSSAYGATGYTIEVDTVLAFSANPQFYNTSVLSYALTNLLPATTYYWRVKSSDGTNSSQWSNTWRFTTKSAPNSITEINGDVFSCFTDQTNDILNVIIGGKDEPSKKYSYNIIDVTGKRLLSGELSDNTNKVLIQGLSSGIYFIQIDNIVSKIFQVMK